MTFHQRCVKSAKHQDEVADKENSYVEKHSQTRTSSAKPTTRLRDLHPLSTKHSERPPRMTTSSTSSRKPTLGTLGSYKS